MNAPKLLFLAYARAFWGCPGDIRIEPETAQQLAKAYELREELEY